MGRAFLTGAIDQPFKRRVSDKPESILLNQELPNLLGFLLLHHQDQNEHNQQTDQKREDLLADLLSLGVKAA